MKILLIKNYKVQNKQNSLHKQMFDIWKYLLIHEFKWTQRSFRVTRNKLMDDLKL